MAAEGQAVEEMDRDDLEDAVQTLRSDVEFLQNQLFQLEDLILGEYDQSHPEANVSENGGILDRIVAIENGDVDNEAKIAGDRDNMLPGHRMYADLLTGADQALGKEQRRAAVIFGRFIERCVSGESNEVDASGQMFTLSSKKVQEVLTEEGEFEGVKEASRPQVVSRVMREVARLSKISKCECEEIEGCQHADVRFVAGRPNKLASPKRLFTARMQDVYGGDVAGDTDDASEKDVEDHQAQARQKMNRLENGFK